MYTGRHQLRNFLETEIWIVHRRSRIIRRSNSRISKFLWNPRTLEFFMPRVFEISKLQASQLSNFFEFWSFRILESWNHQTSSLRPSKFSNLRILKLTRVQALEPRYYQIFILLSSQTLPATNPRHYKLSNSPAFNSSLQTSPNTLHLKSPLRDLHPLPSSEK